MRGCAALATSSKERSPRTKRSTLRAVGGSIPMTQCRCSRQATGCRRASAAARGNSCSIALRAPAWEGSSSPTCTCRLGANRRRGSATALPSRQGDEAGGTRWHAGRPAVHERPGHARVWRWALAGILYPPSSAASVAGTSRASCRITSTTAPSTSTAPPSRNGVSGSERSAQPSTSAITGLT